MLIPNHHKLITIYPKKEIAHLDNINKTRLPPQAGPKHSEEMQILSSALFITLLASVSADRDYDRRAKKSLVAAHSLLEEAVEIGGYCPLPPRPSGSQCSLALERIVKQPQSCAMKYLSKAARNVYSPVYNWFYLQDTEAGDNIVLTAQQLSVNNGVGVEVYDAFGNEVANIDQSGNIMTPDVDKEMGIELARTWPLNYPTFVRENEEGVASIAQNVWSIRGQLLTVVIYKDLNLLPVVC